MFFPESLNKFSNYHQNDLNKPQAIPYLQWYTWHFYHMLLIADLMPFLSPIFLFVYLQIHLHIFLWHLTKLHCLLYLHDQQMNVKLFPSLFDRLILFDQCHLPIIFLHHNLRHMIKICSQPNYFKLLHLVAYS